jgi:hypothetical protein
MNPEAAIENDNHIEFARPRGRRHSPNDIPIGSAHYYHLVGAGSEPLHVCACIRAASTLADSGVSNDFHRIGGDARELISHASGIRFGRPWRRITDDPGANALCDCGVGSRACPSYADLFMGPSDTGPSTTA